MSVPDHEFVAYIDESGDPSLKRVRPIDEVGGTEWFTISAVLVRRQFDADISKWVAAINQELGSTNSQIIHFSHLSPLDRLRTAELLAQYPLRLFVVASNKKNMRQYRNVRAENTYSKQWFYNWMARILIERVTDFCWRYSQRHNLTRRHVKFVFSQTGGHSYSQTAAYHELLRYQARGKKMILNRWVPRWEVMHYKLVEHYPHFKRAGLQLADVVASSFYHAVDNLDTGPCESKYAAALAERIATSSTGEWKDYGVVLQPTPDWAAEISEDQRAIFRFYGYDFLRRR